MNGHAIAAASDGGTAKLFISGHALIGPFEEAVDNLYCTKFDERARIEVDLREATFIEVATLQYIIAFVRKRRLEGKETVLRLPSGQPGAAARDYMRRVEFPKAFLEVTGQNFIDFVAGDDHKYFRGLGGDASLPKYSFPSRRLPHGFKANPLDKGERPVERFFPFVTWEISKYSDRGRIADEALDHYSAELITSVLDRYLYDSGADKEGHVSSAEPASASSYVSSRIVFEAMTNAIRHPGAKWIQACSVVRKSGGLHRTTPIDGPPTPSTDRHFTITVWDDGSPMYDTLRQTLRLGGQIRLPYPTSLDTKYFVKHEVMKGSSTTTSEELVTSSDTPDISAPNERLLLATIFPGITCDVAGIGHRVHRTVSETSPELAGKGMGLFSLVRTAVDRFAGSVAIRTGSIFMNIRKGQRKDGLTANYRVKLEIKSSSTPPFLGNMVTVRLPLNRG